MVEGLAAGLVGKVYTNPTLKPPIFKRSIGSIEKVDAVSMKGLGWGLKPDPLRVAEQESSGRPSDERSEAPTLG